MKSLNELAKEVHAANGKWWTDLKTGERIIRNKGQLLMLVVTELAEAVEGIRKNLPDDKLPHRSMEEVEMADAFIRLLDFAYGFKQNLHELDQTYHPCVYEDKAEAILNLTFMVCKIWQKECEDNGLSISYAIAAIVSYCERFNLDLMGAYAEKMEYNRTREDHKHEARLGTHGKKF